MKTNLFKAALVATTLALTTIGASAAGIGIYVGPNVHHRDFHNYHHRVCNFDHWGHRHCFWR